MTAQCGNGPEFELSRIINPFRRRNGRWLTELTPWLPRLQADSTTCRFSMSILTFNNLYWTPFMSLIYVKEPSIVSTAPFKTLSLGWSNGFKNFNQTYASLFPPRQLALGELRGARRVAIVALISGHGADSNQCAEFCNMTQTFFVNNNPYRWVADDAGTPLGCTTKVPDGAVPNEHGTWLYGRGGWCDGMPVQPVSFDITDSLELLGRDVINFNGTNDGHAPDPTPGVGRAAYIAFEAFLALYD